MFAFAKDFQLEFLKSHRVRTRNVFLAGKENKTFLYSESWPEAVRNQYQTHFLSLSRIKTLETTSMGGSPGKASIMMDGYEYSLNGLGINILVIDNHVQAYSLDTHRDPAASEELATILQKAKDGALIVLAVNDEAAMHLTNKAKQAMQLLGSKEFSSLAYRDSYVFACFKGKRTLFEQRSSSPIQYSHSM